MRKVSILLSVLLIMVLISCSTTKEINLQEKVDETSQTLSPYSKGFSPKETKDYLTEEEVEEDCEYLKFLLSQVYINYETEISEYGFNIEKSVEEIKNLTKAGENEFDKSIDVRVFRTNINKVLAKNLHIPDGHFAIISDYGGSYPFSSYTLLTSNIYFEKKDDSFYVVKSDLENIKPGMKYSGNPNNLYEWYSDSEQPLYRFCIYTNKKLLSGVISVDDEKFPVKFPQTIPELENFFTVSEFDDYIYVKISTFNFSEYLDEFKELVTLFDNMIAQIKKMNPDKNLVVDLRDNTGGNGLNPMKLLSAILFRDNDEAETQLGNYELSKLYYYHVDSSCVINAQKVLSEENPQYESIKDDAIFAYDESETKPDLSKETVFTGKIYYLINHYSASASELMIDITYDFLPKEKITVIGLPSMGTLETGAVYQYYLPNSGIGLSLSSSKIHLNENMNFKGDTKGIFPDFLADDNEIEEILKSGFKF